MEMVTKRQEIQREWEEHKLLLTPSNLKKIKKNAQEEYPNSSKLQKQLIEYKKNEYLAELKIKNNDGRKNFIVSSLFNRDISKIDLLLNQCYRELENATNPNLKCAAIANCMRAILMLHPFPDGNWRTLINVFNLFMVQSGLSPMLLPNSYPFEGVYTTQEMVTVIQQGMHAFQTAKIKVEIGEFSGITPQKKDDATDYKKIQGFYNELDIYFPPSLV